MKIYKLLSLICLLNVCNLNAQINKDDFEKKFNMAEDIFSKIYQNGKEESVTYAKGGYADAVPMLLSLYKEDPTNCNIAFKLGVCYRGSRRYKAQAIPYFGQAVTANTDNYNGSSHKERKAPLVAYKYLGDAYHINYQFDKAIEERHIVLAMGRSSGVTKS